MNAYLAANLAVLEELYDGLAALIRPLDDDCLNWRPLAADTNSIAALTTHIIGSLHSWLARAMDEPVQRDREAEFGARRSADELIRLVEQSRQHIREQFARLEGVEPGTIRHVRRLSTDRDVSISVAWCIEHAVIHAGEHWGQIQLNRQFYAAGRERVDRSGT